MYVYRIRSANYNSALTWPAGAIQVAAGRYRFPNNETAKMRAGMAQDLEAARAFRASGDKAGCRSRLEFARDARRLLQA